MATTSSDELTEQELEAARKGQVELLGRVLETCREHLLVLARQELGPDLAGKLGPSDLVQETFLAAHRDIAAFRGKTVDELRAWLQAILRHRVANARRHYRASAKRNVEREVALKAEPPSAGVGGLANGATSPSGQAMRDERRAALAVALKDLPAHYRQVIEWHHRDRLTFDEIAALMEISSEAARKLWGRALLRLRDALGSEHEP
jgi:RNA polymerase sigma-70 factor (ECF subfamily)